MRTALVIRYVAGLAVAMAAGVGGPAASGAAPAAGPAAVPGAVPAAVVGSGAGPAAALAAMSPYQRVGQLFMVGGAATGVSSATVTAVRNYHVGSVILTGRSASGVGAVRSVSSGLQALATPAATAGVPLLVSADQEGGQVQTFSGSGFSGIPSALTQGGWAASTVASSARVWGSQLAAAGVNLDLAPVLDTVPAATAGTNGPIGVFQREFGHDPATVTAKGVAALEGFRDGGVLTTIKHFPGLGRVVGNTDTTANVVDSVTTRNDAYLAPFTAGVQHGADFVLVSLATYAKIDPSHIAAFSPTVMRTMLRGDLHFPGVIISDDLGNAAAVRSVSPANRAVDFLSAGGDVVLTVNPSLIPEMVNAVNARYLADPGFAAQVNASVLRVLIAKQQAGLVGGRFAAGSLGGRPTLLQRMNDDSLTARDASGGGWAGSTFSLGGRLLYGPGIAAPTTGAIIPMAHVGTTSVPYVASYALGGGHNTWLSLGGGSTSAPAVAAAPGRTDVAIRGGTGTLYIRSGTSSAVLHPWQNLGGSLDGAPALAYAKDGTLIAVVTNTDGTLSQRVRRGTVWSGWSSLGGVTIGGPALAVDATSGQIRLFTHGSDGALWYRTEASANGPWSGWKTGGGGLVGSPTATPAGAGATRIVVEGTDGALYQQTDTNGVFTGFSKLPF